LKITHAWLAEKSGRIGDALRNLFTRVDEIVFPLRRTRRVFFDKNSGAAPANLGRLTVGRVKGCLFNERQNFLFEECVNVKRVSDFVFV
jgi:hypothetical protein